MKKTGFMATAGGKITASIIGVAVLATAGLGAKAFTDNKDDRRSDGSRRESRRNEDEDKEKDRLTEILETEARPTEPMAAAEPSMAEREAEPSIPEETAAAIESALLVDPYAAPDTGWKSAYRDIVDSVSISDFCNGDCAPYADLYELSYGLVLINDDDIPELVIYFDTTLDNYTWLYTYSDGEAVFMEELYNWECPALYAPRENRTLSGTSYNMYGDPMYQTISFMDTDNRSMIDTYPDLSECMEITDEFGSYEIIEENYNAALGFGTYNYEELTGGYTESEIMDILQ